MEATSGTDGYVRVLLRHADAGVRGERNGPDGWRRLSRVGAAQAQEVVTRLWTLDIQRVLSSPSLRCRQTVAPLAAALSLEVEPLRLLAADADPEPLARFLREDETRVTVLCTHRETLEALFGRLARDGLEGIEGVAAMRKAAAWLLRGPAGAPPARVQYLPSRIDVPAPWPVAGSW
jgi:phosphohistidine phosphatase SixA